MLLQIDQVTKQFGKNIAVNQFSAQLETGVYGLIGPNGSGKTTLLRILADVARPTSGRVLYNHVDIRLLDENYRDVLGYVPQQVGVYRSFTAERFLHYMATLKGLTKAEANSRIDEVLDLVNLEAERRTKLGKLSGGMKQRIAIAQALLNHPKVLILDEPTVGLDPTERTRFLNLVAAVSRNRIALLATHIVSDVDSLASRVLVMNRGQLVREGTPNELLESLRGQVWTIRLSEREASAVPRQMGQRLVRSQSHIELRVISARKPSDDAEPATPNLEDLYLSQFPLDAQKEAK